MPPPDLLAVLVVTLAATGVALYDLYAYLRWGNSATISIVFWRLGKDWPIFPFLVGFLLGVVVGHVFWPHAVE